MKSFKYITPEPYSELNQFLNKNSFSMFFVLVDSNTKKHCLPEFEKIIRRDLSLQVISIAAGERQKNLESCQSIWEQLSELGADRQSLLINLGGGVITDIGGFAASTYLRGIPFINFPTSLLGMVDASIGGKTGVNFNGLKNNIGLFNSSSFIGIDHKFLATLPECQLKSGYAEMLKHGLIADAEHWQNLISQDPEKTPTLELIQNSMEIKESVVNQDQKEKGLRKILNFGHTLGHAIESLSLKKDTSPLLHGEAIALGIILETFLSIKTLGFPKQDFKKIKAFILNYYPKRDFNSEDFKDIKQSILKDKKNEAGKVNFVLLHKIGTAQIDCKVPEKLIEEAFEDLKDHKI